MRKVWFIIAGVIIVAGIGSGAFLFLGHQGAGSLTVSELRSQAESLQDSPLTVEGKVTPGSVDWDEGAQVIRFVLTDGKESLRITYQGIMPDGFKPGNELKVQGRYGADGIFEASGFGSGNSFCAVCH